MDANDFKPNSHKYQDSKKDIPEKKVQKVISGKAKVKKKSELRKFSDIFVSEDASKVKNYVFMDVLIPAVKKAIVDIVTDGVHMIFYGDTGHSDRRRSLYKVSYNRMGDRDYDRSARIERQRSGYDFGDIILDSRGEAEAVLTGLEEIIEHYGLASVGDLYDLVGQSGNFTDNKYGWDSMRSASVIRTRDGGYMLKLPKAMPL